MADEIRCRGEGRKCPASEFRKQSGYVIHWTVDPQHTVDGEPWPPTDLPTGDLAESPKPMTRDDVMMLEDAWRDE